MANFRSWRTVARLNAAETGFNASPLNAAITGATFDATGADGLTLYVQTAFSAANGTLKLQVEAYDDVQAAWVILNTISIAAGVGTLSTMSIEHAATAALNYEVRLTELRFHKMRLKMLAAVASANASDTVTITGELTAVGG